MYFSPNPTAQALALHYDSQHNFIHQLKGAKHWRLLPDYGAGQYTGSLKAVDLNDESINTVDFRLNEGQLLYLPYRLPHIASCASDGSSLHLTYAFCEISTKDRILGFIHAKLEQTLRGKESIFQPVIGNSDCQLEVIQKAVDSCNEIQANTYTREFLKQAMMKKMQIFTKGIKYR